MTPGTNSHCRACSFSFLVRVWCDFQRRRWFESKTVWSQKVYLLKRLLHALHPIGQRQAIYFNAPRKGAYLKKQLGLLIHGAIDTGLVGVVAHVDVSLVPSAPVF